MFGINRLDSGLKLPSPSSRDDRPRSTRSGRMLVQTVTRLRLRPIFVCRSSTTGCGEFVSSICAATNKQLYFWSQKSLKMHSRIRRQYLAPEREGITTPRKTSPLEYALFPCSEPFCPTAMIRNKPNYMQRCEVQLLVWSCQHGSHRADPAFARPVLWAQTTLCHW